MEWVHRWFESVYFEKCGTKSAPLVVWDRFKKKRYHFPIDYSCHYNPLKCFISSHIHPNDSFRLSFDWVFGIFFGSFEMIKQMIKLGQFFLTWVWPDIDLNSIQFITANESPDSAQAVHLQANSNKFNSSSIRKDSHPKYICLPFGAILIWLTDMDGVWIYQKHNKWNTG